MDGGRLARSENPLSVIKGYTVLLSSSEYDWEPDQVRGFSRIMGDRVEYMERLIEDFGLTFRLKNDALPLRLEPNDLVRMTRDILKQLQSLPESADKTFLFETNRGRIPLDLDPGYMQRALENVIANSIKHNPPGTTVKITINEERGTGGRVRIGIEDNGAGMDQETLARLFERYFRGQTHRPTVPAQGSEWPSPDRSFSHTAEKSTSTAGLVRGRYA